MNIVDKIAKWWKNLQMSETDRWLAASADLSELESKLKFLTNQTNNQFTRFL